MNDNQGGLVNSPYQRPRVNIQRRTELDELEELQRLKDQE